MTENKIKLALISKFKCFREAGALLQGISYERMDGRRENT